MTINELLSRYNGGILRGAKKRLAQRIGFDKGTVSRWMNGTLNIGEESLRRVSKELGVPPEELAALLKDPGICAGSGAKRPEIAELVASIDELKLCCAALTERVATLERGGKKICRKKDGEADRVAGGKD